MKQGMKQKQKKRINIGTVGVATYIMALLFRLPLGYIIGDQGVAYFSVGMELFLFITCITAYGLSKSVTIAVKYRVRREQYKNARKVFRYGLFLSGIISLLAGAAMLVFSEWIGNQLFLNSLSYLSITAITPAVFLMSLTSIWRGYYLGMGSAIPVIHSKWIEKILLFAAGLVFAYLFFGYGLKVAKLLQGSHYAYSYGGFGAAFGVSVVSLLVLLHLWIISIMLGGAGKANGKQEPAKSGESGGQIIAVIVATALPYIALALIYNLPPLVDLILYWQTMKKSGEIKTGVLHWGIYYGKYIALTGLLIMIPLLSGMKRIPVIMRSHEQHNSGEMQKQAGGLIHQIVILAAPLAVIFAVTAQSMSGILGQENAVITAQIFQTGAVMIFLFPVAYLLGTLLMRTRRNNIVLAGGALAFAVHIILLLVLLNNSKLGIRGVVLCQCVFYLTASLLFLACASRELGIRINWMRTFGVTGIAAGVTGLIGILIQKGLLLFAGNVLSFLLTLLFCIILYPALILILKGVNEEELEQIPGGSVFILIGEKLKLL